MPDKYDSPGYRRSRAAYTAECAFEYFVSLMVVDSVLAVLLKNLGMSDSSVGVISSLISLAFLFQLCTVPVISRVTDTKTFAIVFHALGQFSFAFLFLTPYLPFGPAAGRVCAVLLIILAYFGNYFVNSVIFGWGNSKVRPGRKGRFSAVKEMISLFSGIAVQLAAGAVMDAYSRSGNVRGSFVFIAVSCCVFSACDLTCLILMERERAPADRPAGRRMPLREALSGTLGVREFRSVVILDCLRRAAIYTAVGFVGTYKVGELGFSVTAVQLVNIAAQLARLALSMPFGRLTDRTSYSGCAGIGFAMTGAAFLALAFTTPSAPWLIIVFALLYESGMAAHWNNMSMLAYSFVGAEYRTAAFAVKNAAAGLAGFLASLAAGRALSAVPSAGNTVFGMRVYGQQVLGFAAFLLCVACVVYNALTVNRYEKRLPSAQSE